MVKLIRWLSLFILIGIVLVSCGKRNNDDAKRDIQPTPANLLILTTSANPLTYSQAGQQVTFNYLIRNMGATNLGPGQCTVTDSLLGPTPFNCGPADATLAPGATVNCSANYIVSQADLTAVSLTNIATASCPGAIPSSPANATVNKVTGTLALTASANPSVYSQAGQSITFTYVIQNTGPGNVGPAQCTVTDSLVSATPINCGSAGTTLAPGATVTCSANYSIRQADTTAVSITNIATGSCAGAAPSPYASTTVNKTNSTPHTVEDGEWVWQIARCFGVDPHKLVADNRNQLPDPNQIKAGITLLVNNPGSYSKNYGPPCVKKHTVQSGDTWNSIAQICNADPTILQVANSNTMTVGKEVKVPCNSAGAALPPAQNASLSLTTTVNPAYYDQAGQVITFTYLIKNNGNSTLGPTQFTVKDSLISPTPFNCGSANTTLAPAQMLTCSANYSVTQADLGAVSITNIATTSGGGAGPSPSASATVNRGTRALALDTTASPVTYSQAGQVITFTYVIRNSGNITLSPAQFTVSDSLISPTPFNCGPANTALAPNANVTCFASYTVKPEDMSAVSITNIATATGGGLGPVQDSTEVKRQ